MRADNWYARLLKEFEAAHGRRFRWGQHDCCQFVRRVAIAVSGRPLRRHFPVYRTKAQADAIVAKFGGYRELLSYAFGEPSHVSTAKDGDIVLVDFGRGQGLQPAVCRGVYSYAPGMRNLQMVETAKAVAAWVF